MNNLYKVEFIKGENWCRIDGVLLNNEEYLKRTGISFEFDNFNKENKIIVSDEAIYISPMNIDKAIKAVCYFQEGTGSEYDEAASYGRGWSKHSTTEELVGRYGSYLISKEYFDNIKNYNIYPYEQFFIDYPDFNEEEYFKIQESLDYYYAFELNNEIENE